MTLHTIHCDILFFVFAGEKPSLLRNTQQNCKAGRSTSVVFSICEGGSNKTCVLSQIEIMKPVSSESI